MTAFYAKCVARIIEHENRHTEMSVGKVWGILQINFITLFRTYFRVLPTRLWQDVLQGSMKNTLVKIS